MRLNFKVILALAFLILAGTVYMIADWLIESEEERLEAWLVQLAKDLPNRDPERYLDAVDLEHFGFRLDYRGVKHSFGQGEQDAFLLVTNGLAKTIRGSLVSVRSVKVEVKNDVANASMTVFWERGQAKEAWAERALMNFEGQLARGEEGWKIARLKAMPAFGGREQ